MDKRFLITILLSLLATTSFAQAPVFQQLLLYLQAELRLVAAPFGRQHHACRQRVHVVEVLPGKEGDGRVLLVGNGYELYGVCGALVAQHPLQPLVAAHQRQVVYGLGLQVGVAAFVGKAVVVLQVAVQFAVRGTAGLGGVAQRQVGFAHGHGQRQVGEEVVVVAALSGLAHAAVVIVGRDVLVAQPGVGL